MTLVFRNRLDPDNGRAIFMPSGANVTNVSELKSALLTAGNYIVAPGLYVADLIANVAGVHLQCLPGTIFRATGLTTEAWTIMASNFSLTGTWQVDCGGQLGMGIGDNTATTQAQQPDNVLLDGGHVVPFYFGSGGTGSATRGIACHGSNVTIRNCVVEGFWRGGNDCQAVWVNNTNGPITITDCFLEGSTENFMSGGDGIQIPNAVPSDIYIARCTFYKRPSWRPPAVVSVKNIFELKNAKRVVLEDCVLDGSWKGAQTGNGIVLTVRNATSAIWDWVIVDDITIRHNIVRNCYQPGGWGVSILGHDTNGRASEQTRTIRILNNLFEDCDNGVQVSKGVTDLLLIDHNTFASDISAEVLQFADASTKTTLSMTNNAGNQGAYGVFANGVSAVCIAALNGACNPGYVVTGNIWGRNQTQNVVWPSGNTVIGPAGTMLALTANPDAQLTGAQAGADAGWSGPTGVGLNGDGTTQGGQP